jgi:hypothetical protein
MSTGPTSLRLTPCVVPLHNGHVESGQHMTFVDIQDLLKVGVLLQPCWDLSHAIAARVLLHTLNTHCLSHKHVYKAS